MLEIMTWVLALINLIWTNAWAGLAFLILCAYVIAVIISIRKDKAIEETNKENIAYNEALAARIEQERIEKETPFVCACSRRFKSRQGYGKHIKTCNQMETR